MAKRKYNELSLENKKKVIRDSIQLKLSQQKLAIKHGISKSQVNRILLNKEHIQNCPTLYKQKKRKRLNGNVKYPAVREKILNWISKKRKQNVTLGSHVIRRRALKYGARYNHFKASSGWLRRLFVRHNISYRIINGESASVDANVVNEWLSKLPELIEGYELRDIYNMDETGLFYRYINKKSFVVKGDKCNGIKQCKDRITVCLLTSAIGEKEPPVIIGKFKRPRCFQKRKVEDHFNAYWQSNATAWMTKEIFTLWMEKLNRKMRRARRKIILFMDNAPSHPKIELSNVRIEYFPANTTPVLQPMDAGIIKQLKDMYRIHLEDFRIAEMTDNESESDGERMPPSSVETVKISLWQAIAIIDQTWSELSAELIFRCFQKCGFDSTCPVSSQSIISELSTLLIDLLMC